MFMFKIDQNLIFKCSTVSNFSCNLLKSTGNIVCPNASVSKSKRLHVDYFGFASFISRIF